MFPGFSIPETKCSTDSLWFLWNSLGHEIPSSSRRKELSKMIKVKESVHRHTKILTFSPNPPKRNMSDDIVYAENPELQKMLPRAMSLIFIGSNLVNVIWGPRKFCGASLGDDDDDESAESGLYKPDLTKAWIMEDKCRIVETVKENGKFAIMNLFVHGDVIFVAFGSKNVHHVCPLDELYEFLQDDTLSDIVLAVGQDILRNRDALTNLMSYFLNGFCIVGELCDGRHFTKGDGRVKWFGLFKEGCAMEPMHCLHMLRSHSLPVVDCQEVFHPGDPYDKLADVFSSAKCQMNEGSVMHIINVETGQTQLVKVKSARYKLLRALREKIKQLRPDIYDKYKTRIVHMKDYHGLNTEAAIYATRIAFSFIEWLFVDQMLPCKCVDFNPIEAVRGNLGKEKIGFAYWWGRFVEATGHDIEFNPDHFKGDFDEDVYLNSPVLRVFPDIPVEKQTTVLFIQGIQGSGKSVTAHELINIGFSHVEQDVCYGDTNTCQFLLSWYLRMGCNVVVSRCNANSKQYQRYLDIAHRMHSKVLFVCSTAIKSPLYAATSLAGVLNRSSEGDKVLVGRKELNFTDVVEFTCKNWKSMTPHTQALCLPTYEHDEYLETEATAAISSGNFAEFVVTNQQRLMALRIPLGDTVRAIECFISDPPKANIVNRPIGKTLYIGFHVHSKDREELVKITGNPEIAGRIYCDHVTQAFKPKLPLVSKNQEGKCIEPGIPGNQYTIMIDALVVDRTSGSSAFRVNSILNAEGNQMQVITGIPHITAFVAEGHKPVESIGFVLKSDDSVTIHELDEVLSVRGVCRYN